MHDHNTQILMNMRSDLINPIFNWKGRKILILEDDYANYLLFHEILSCAHACLIRAVSLQEAFDMINSAVRFDLMIMNVDTPGNENCRSIKRLKALWPDLRVIAYGGCVCNRSRNCVPWGCDMLITPPFDEHEMLAVVDELFTQVK
jgi:CheY-like chemotaxis protein